MNLAEWEIAATIILALAALGFIFVLTVIAQQIGRK